MGRSCRNVGSLQSTLKVFSGRLIGRRREGRQKKRLSEDVEDGRVEIQGRSRKARERNNCDGLQHKGVSK